MIATYQTHRPCQVFDANGLEWKHMRWVNTETGEGEQADLDSHGRHQVDWARNALKTKAVKLAAPVLLVPIDRKDGQ